MLLSYINNPPILLAILAAFTGALTIHEFAHAWVADRLGDPTPRLTGRLTLNPKAHLDLVGSLMILVAPFGWAKPVHIDSFNFKNPRRDTALASLAGPVTNLAGAVIASLLLHLMMFLPPQPVAFFSILMSAIFTLLSMFIVLNVNLALFNLIPIHPLDGFSIVEGILPEREARQWAGLRSLGIIMLFLFVIPIFGGQSPVLQFISPIISSITGLLLP